MRVVPTSVQKTADGYTVQYDVLGGTPERPLYNGSVTLDPNPTLWDLRLALIADVKSKSPEAYIHYLFELVNRALQ